MNRIMNIVNFVRGIEPRMEMDLYTPVAEQIRVNKQYGIANTFLLQYDAMRRQDFRDLFLQERDENMELGVWFENCRELIERVGLPWRGREGYDWDWYVDVGFLEGYTPAEREAIVDEVFRLFKEIFGAYPQVVGSWLIDAHSMDYMCRKYDIKAFCICREQYAVDAYTLWGGYSNGGYYPSKNNMLCPAQSAENQIPAPLFRMLMPDPIYNYDGEAQGYGVCTLEPAWTSGQNPEITDWYLDAYYKTPCLTHAHATTGQENSFGQELIGKGYPMQIEKLVALQKQGVVSLQKLGDTGTWYQQNFPMSAPTAQVALQDRLNEGRARIWYNCRNYRCGLYRKDDVLSFCDITKYDDRYPERYLDQPCEGWLATYDNLPIVDGRLWSTAEKPSILRLQKPVLNISAQEQTETTLCVHIAFEDGTAGTILCSEEGITMENCGALYYSWGTPTEDTVLTFADNCLKGVRRDFAYSVPVEAQVEQQGESFLISPKNGKITLQLDFRK